MGRANEDLIGRRSFLAAGVSAFLLPLRAPAAGDNAPQFTTRGIVLVPEDLTLADWPERAKAAGLTTIGIHHQDSPQAVID